MMKEQVVKLTKQSLLKLDLITAKAPLESMLRYSQVLRALRLHVDPSFFPPPTLPLDWSRLDHQAAAHSLRKLDSLVLDRTLRLINSGQEDHKEEIKYLDTSLKGMLDLFGGQIFKVGLCPLPHNCTQLQLNAGEAVQKFEENYITNAAAKLESEGQFDFAMSFIGKSLRATAARQSFYKFMQNVELQTLQRIWNTPLTGIAKTVSDISKQGVHLSESVTIAPNYLDITLEEILRGDLRIRKGVNNKPVRQLVILPKKGEGDVLEQLQGYKEVLLHFHGGGFISLTPQCAQLYTRKWANELGIAVVATDYSKSPQARFPQALNQCLRSYLYFRERLSKATLILGGDSAGANLACGVVNLLLKTGQPCPQAMVLSCPALCLDNRRFSHSHLNSLKSNILAMTVLQQLLKGYLGEEQLGLADHPLVSPLYSNSRFKRGPHDQPWPEGWPNTLFVLAGEDSLRDDGFMTARRVANSKSLYCKDIVHGFLGMGFFMGLKQANVAIEKTVEMLRELIAASRTM